MGQTERSRDRIVPQIAPRNGVGFSVSGTTGGVREPANLQRRDATPTRRLCPRKTRMTIGLPEIYHRFFAGGRPTGCTRSGRNTQVHTSVFPPSAAAFALWTARAPSSSRATTPGSSQTGATTRPGSSHVFCLSYKDPVIHLTAQHGLADEAGLLGKVLSSRWKRHVAEPR